MSSSMAEVRLVVLRPEAHRTVCGLVPPTDEIDPTPSSPPRRPSAELRSAFPASEAHRGEERPAARLPSAETARILDLNDAETFTDLNECRAFEIPAEWEVDEIEEALAGMRLR